MMTTIKIEYDCGYIVTIPTSLRPDQSALRQPAAIDTAIMIADATHDTTCPTCHAEETQQ
jgi:hypothetical protein